MNKVFNRVNDIVKIGMCTGCGACTNVCNNIKIDNKDNYNVPVIGDKCIKCGKCLKVCTAKNYISRIKKNIININKKNLCYITYSTEYKLRYNCASGGTVSTIIIYLLENKFIDEAICIKQSENNPLKSNIVLIKNKLDMFLCHGSIYSPVSICDSLNKLLISSKKYAIVGKPCDIEAISNLQKNDILFKNIIFKISLMCAGTPSRNGTKQLISYMGEDRSNIKNIKYRGNGWPGKISIENKSGHIKTINYIDGWNNILSKECINARCKYCDDPFGSFSDITVGDAWDPEYLKRNEEGGFNCIICNTIEGIDIINKLIKSNKIYGQKITLDKVLNMQSSLTNKLFNIKDRIIYLANCGIHIDNKLILKICNYKVFPFLKLKFKIYKLKIKIYLRSIFIVKNMKKNC